MGKSITFTTGDEKLIKEIIAYQQEQGIKSFVETVRQLCKKGLSQNVSVKINLK